MRVIERNKFIILFIIVILFLAILDIYMFDSGNTFSQLLPSAGGEKPAAINRGWQLRWGDSDYDTDGKLLWLTAEASDSGTETWTDFTIPLSPSNTKKYRNIWLKAPLPSGEWHEPSLLFRTYEQSIQVYLEDNLIYQYGNWDNSNRSLSLKSPWHLVELPSDFQGRNIFFRVKSGSPIYAGDREEVLIGSKADLINYRISNTTDTVRQRADSLILSFMFIFMGSILILLYFLRKSELQVTLSLGFFSICMGVWIFTESSTKFLFLDAPIVWLYTGYISCQLIPVGFCRFVEKVFGDTEKKLIAYSRKAFIILLVLNFLLDVLNILPWSVSIRAFHLLLVLTISIIVYVTVNAARRGDQEAKILTLSFIVLSVFGIYDMVDRFYLPIALLKGHHITQWAMFIFTLSLIYIVARRFMDVYDKLRLYSREIEDKNDRLEAMWREVKKSRDQIEDWNKGLEQIVIQKTMAVKNLLDNAGQGFLTFGSDFRIDKEYSLECVKIFGEKIENRSFSELICSSEEERKYLELTLLKIFGENRKSKQEIYIPLLPDEVVINGKNINLQYKVIDLAGELDQKVFMVVLTDITEKRALESKVEAERKTLKMVVKAVTDHNEFTKCIENYTNFCRQGLNEILDAEIPLEDKLFEIYRRIHTFKGSFAQNDMVNIVDKLHDFEESLSDLRYRANILTLDSVRALFMPPEMEKWLEADMSILKDILGESYFDYERVLFVDQVKLLELENKMASSLSPELLKELLPDIKALRYKPFKELFRPYPKFVTKLSDQLDKLVNPLNIEGGEMLVDADRYFSFSRALVHVFKNIVDHGIESPDERIENGKNEYGNISCSMDLKDNTICVKISDDGAGIDVNRIKEELTENGILQNEKASGLTDDEILQHVFLDGITTRNSVNQVSGRGVGLSAVKSEVEKLGGTISIKSKPGIGTELNILLPFDGLLR